MVNTYTTGYAAEPDVAANKPGDFVLVWSNAEDDGISGQRFRSWLFIDGFESGNTTVWTTTVR